MKSYEMWLVTNVTDVSETMLNPKNLFHTSFHRKIDQIKKLNSFDDFSFSPEIPKGIYSLFQLE